MSWTKISFPQWWVTFKTVGRDGIITEFKVSTMEGKWPYPSPQLLMGRGEWVYAYRDMVDVDARCSYQRLGYLCVTLTGCEGEGTIAIVLYETTATTTTSTKCIIYCMVGERWIGGRIGDKKRKKGGHVRGGGVSTLGKGDGNSDIVTLISNMFSTLTQDHHAPTFIDELDGIKELWSQQHQGELS